MKTYFKGIGLLVLAIFILSVYFLSPFPVVDEVDPYYPEQFAVSTDNYFETQILNECSAFSSAYLLRHFGEEQQGLALYEELHYKLPFSGYVLPKGIIEYFKEHHYDIQIYKGTLDSLKTQLLKGHPLIVLVGDGLNWQHYMTLVGYNDALAEVYFFDSLKEGDQNGEFPGNRTLSTDYFLSMWENGLPIFNHLYFTIQPFES